MAQDVGGAAGGGGADRRQPV